MRVEGCYESERMRETIYNKRGEAEEQSRVRLGTDWGRTGRCMRDAGEKRLFTVGHVLLLILPTSHSAISVVR